MTIVCSYTTSAVLPGSSAKSILMTAYDVAMAENRLRYGSFEIFDTLTTKHISRIAATIVHLSELRFRLSIDYFDACKREGILEPGCEEIFFDSEMITLESEIKRLDALGVAK